MMRPTSLAAIEQFVHDELGITPADLRDALILAAGHELRELGDTAISELECPDIRRAVTLLEAAARVDNEIERAAT